MALVKRIHHDAVEGARFGKFNLADNSTVLMYRIGPTVIDAGPPNQWKPVRSWLEEKPVTSAILSHHHEDHSGNGARISKYFGIPVYIHESGNVPAQNGFPLKLYQKVFWGRPKSFTPEPLPESISTGTGHTLIPIHTPGHSPDHICLLEPDKKWLFTGDLYLATRPKLFRADEHLEGEIKSLKSVLSYDFKTVFCAHKGIVPNGYDALQEKLDYFLGLVQDVKKLHTEGCSVKDITAMRFGKKDTIRKITFSHLCFENLIRECLRVDDNAISECS